MRTVRYGVYERRVGRRHAAAASAVARTHGLPCNLLLALVMQESQFYHCTWWEPFWTRLFLALRAVPVRRLRDKSLGLCSIKPATAVRLLSELRGEPPSVAEAARVVALDHEVSMQLAALELRSHLDRGGTAASAFLAYAARPRTALQLVAEPDAVVASRPAFQQRLRAFEHYVRVASTLCEAVDDGGCVTCQ